MKALLNFILLLILIGCRQSSCKDNSTKNSNTSDTIVHDKVKTIQEKESASIQKSDTLGTLLTTIAFDTNATSEDLGDGVLSGVSIENPKKGLQNLIEKDKIVLNESKVTVIIDYPLTNAFKLQLVSTKGFSRKLLLEEISKAYYNIYKMEEKTGSIKTIPVDKRTTMYNRNETNGKYGIWGHDISDLILTKIFVYKTVGGEIILDLEIES